MVWGSEGCVVQAWGAQGQGYTKEAFGSQLIGGGTLGVRSKSFWLGAMSRVAEESLWVLSPGNPAWLLLRGRCGWEGRVSPVLRGLLHPPRATFLTSPPPFPSLSLLFSMAEFSSFQSGRT